ncbi:adenylyl-sulfate kinase [Zhouia amylolytica]|uniref:Adenylyl-sulfate kinase n=1 Tax=Zhouia amylolytica AD3 TaxID=1286632 RepID=W2UR77_9FLAO|nr:adenylyl-sulfate kinase [Zhouia amylolytica]ETN95807.1 adenylylsulfate kinase [Zhouia amylolytica AD3]
MEKNIIPHTFKISKEVRNEQNKHRSFLIWLTGLSGSGKSTIACALEQRLHEQDLKTYVLDGDNIRRGINKNLSFSPEDRSENIRRIGEIANLFIDAGVIVLAAFVSPYKEDREHVKEIVGADNYVEVFVNASLEECERRDVKGLYAKARKGEIKNLTGISAPYEIPENPDVEVTHIQSVKVSVESIYNVIKEKIQLDSHE